MTRRIGFFDAAHVSLGMAALAAGMFGEPVLEIVYRPREDHPPRRRRQTDEPRRETSRSPAPLPGDLKRWAYPVVIEMPRQQRRALVRQFAKGAARPAAPVAMGGADG